MLVKRRAVLALPGLAFAGMVPTPEVARAAQPQDDASARPADVSLRLARFVSGAAYESLSPAAIAATKRSILDAIGVSLAATGLEPTCEPFVQLALETAGPPDSSVFGRKSKVGAAAAALANGSLAHALDYEDVHDPSGMHPNAAAVPAALAIAEARGAVSGRELITAIAVGCDIACRLGLARRFNLNRYGWYYPPIAGAFGATASCARLLGLDERQVLDALSLTLCQTSCSSELINNAETHVRAIRDGFAAQTAVSAAKLARAGVRGFDKPFEGEHGFATMYARGAFDFDALTVDLGRRFHGEDISFKAWPACRGAHRYIQAALAFAEEKRVAPADIVSIKAYVTPLDEMLCVPRESKSAPSTAIDAKFSIPFTVATALLNRQVVLDSFSAQGLADAEVTQLARRVTHQVDAARVESGGTILVVKDRSGGAHELSVGALLGSPGNPVGDDFLMRKFVECAGHSREPLQPAQAQRIAARLLSLEKVSDVRTLLSA